jgi:hypothetical protein
MRKKIKGKLTQREENQIDNLLDNLPEAPKDNTKRVLSKEQREKLGVQIKNVIGEYLDCFLVLGYTSEGLRVIINDVKNPRDQDALNNLIAETTEDYFAEQEFLKHGKFELDEDEDDF